MPMQLMIDDDSAIPIPLDDCLWEAWVVQYTRASHAGRMDGFKQRLASCFALSLAECLDADLKPPTDAQLRYATSIARELGIPLPSEAIRFRGSMAEFIDRFAEAFRQKRRSYGEDSPRGSRTDFSE